LIVSLNEESRVLLYSSLFEIRIKYDNSNRNAQNKTQILVSCRPTFKILFPKSSLNCRGKSMECKIALFKMLLLALAVGGYF
jgi:hypothetical protein